MRLSILLTGGAPIDVESVTSAFEHKHGDRLINMRFQIERIILFGYSLNLL